MKKVLLISFLAAALFAFLMGSVALAAGYIDPLGNPHGNYASTSNKCKQCHGVHEAVPTGEALLRSTVADACIYCHVSATFGITTPYGTVAANYTTDVRWNHSSVGYTAIQNNYYDVYESLGSVTTIKATCTSCHSVHGATQLVYSVNNILKKDPSGLGRTPATSEDTFCANCHNTAHGPNTNYNGTSHTQRAAGASYGNPSATFSGRVANTASTYCGSCHRKGTGAETAPKNSFPHFTGTGVGSTDTGNWEFLVGQPGADYVGYNQLSNTGTPTMGGPGTARLDSVCLECHYDGVTFGVGYTF